MAQTSQHFTAQPDHVTLIICPNCAAGARLVRCSGALIAEGKGEIRTFECDECRALTEMVLRD